MAKLRLNKKERHNKLVTLLEENPFLTDEVLSDLLDVSIQTIRLDRLALDIKEVRERLKTVALQKHDLLRSISKSDIVGELIELKANCSGISYLETDNTMAFKRTDVIKGHYIFAMAESLALAVIDAKVALTGVANIKYHQPVYLGDKLVAKAKVVRFEGNAYYVHIKISIDGREVFRSKFKLTVMEGLANENSN